MGKLKPKDQSDLKRMKDELAEAEKKMVNDRYAEFGYLVSKLPDAALGGIMQDAVAYESLNQVRGLSKPKIAFQFFEKKAKAKAATKV